MVKDLGFRQSPNHRNNRGPFNNAADMIVYHITEGAFDGAVNWVTQSRSQVSYTFLTAQDGRFIQTVDLNHMAWANGNNDATRQTALVEEIRNRPHNANLFTFSVGNEGWSFQRGYGLPTPAQRQAMWEVNKRIVDFIMTYNPKWRANRNNVIGHAQVTPRTRPSCPMANFGQHFPWDEIIEEINTYLDSGCNKVPEYPDASESKEVKSTPSVPVDVQDWPGINRHNGMNGHQIPFVLEILPSILSSMEGAIPNSVRIAQAIQESGWGTSRLSREANAIFGIKADRRWAGAIFNIRTGEWSPTLGNHTVNADFRAYDSWDHSIKDHILFLKENPRYAPLFKMITPDEVAHGLQTAGYATDPNYAETLIRLIDSNHLRFFDTMKPVASEDILIDVPPEVLETAECLVRAAGIKKGTVVKVKYGSRSFHDEPIASFVFEREYPVSSWSGERVVLGNGLNTAFNVRDLIVTGNASPPVVQNNIQVGSMVRIKDGAKWMTDPPKDIPKWVFPMTLRVDALDGTRAILDKNGINSPININNLNLV